MALVVSRLRAGMLVALVLALPGVAPAGNARESPQGPPPAEIHIPSGAPVPVALRAPEGFDASRAYPLVVALHGRGGSEADFLRAWALFDKPAFLFAVPQAPYPLGDGFSWDAPSRDRAERERADLQITRHVLDVVAGVREHAKVGPVYLYAFSQGVSYAYLTALLHPGRVRGLVCFAGVFPAGALDGKVDPKAARGLRVFVAHGRQDEAVPVSAAYAAKQALEKLGATVTYREFEGGHQVPRSILREAQAWIERSSR